jgi:hypothetical protein
MKHRFALILFILFTCTAEAQYSRHIIQFRNKGGTSFSLDRPSEFLSAKAIARRTRFQYRYRQH